MTIHELLALLLFCLALPLLVGIGVLAWARKRFGLSRKRWQEALVLAALSVILSLVIVFLGRSGWGSYVGVRDVKILGTYTYWAPFSFIAVLLALPVVIWWSRKGSRA